MGREKNMSKKQGRGKNSVLVRGKRVLEDTSADTQSLVEGVGFNMNGGKILVESRKPKNLEVQEQQHRNEKITVEDELWD